MKKVVALIQARMGSSRLPNKMMLSLHGKPILHWVLQRVSKSKNIDEVVLATSVNRENDILENYTKHNFKNVKVFRGSEDDVLNRFYKAGKNAQASHIVRVCADNPLIDGVEIDRLVDFYFQNSFDYAYNHIPKNNTYPDGLGAEILSFQILEEMEKKVKSENLREHSFSYVWENMENFQIGTFNPPKEIAFPNLRFDIDTFDDYYYLSSLNFDIDIDSADLVKLFSEKK
ncbi:spore coat polysaccharide biosynthesis protein F, CMP-KDO synthetase [Thiovulum sp. ES]|nr:spore coat polysaccharide biosynthesis protein F, CMP-KDO synthetase [Thiovulum sp. ES]